MDNPQVEKMCPRRDRLRRRRFGVYDVAYEEAPSPLSQLLRMHALLDGLEAARGKFPAARRFLADTVRLAPRAFAAYMVTAVWQGVYQAINLYFLSLFLDRLAANLIYGTSAPGAFRYLAASWILCAVINIPAERIHARSQEILAERFRSYFLPQLISASLRVDLLCIQDLQTMFPIRGRFATEFPGGRFLTQLSLLIQRTLELVSQVYVLVHAISSKRSPEREILSLFCIVRGIVLWLAPSNSIGSSAYIYWPNNPHYRRMKDLYGLAFSTEYRADLMLDGIVGFIEAEYKKSAELLGGVGGLEPTPWCTCFWRHWYWDVLAQITTYNPMAIYALIFSAYVSPSSISSLMLLEHAAKSISLSIGQYIADTTPSLLNVCMQAEYLYAAIDHKSSMLHGSVPYPRPICGVYDAGMKISFRHVSLRYKGSTHDALSDVSFDVQPGELVLVVGANGSGKSTMLKLLARLYDPSAGGITIDDIPAVLYDPDQLRAAMAFQQQAPVVYPVSVRDNIAFSLPPEGFHGVEHEDVEAAARASGCAEWIGRLEGGYETILEPSFDVNNGWWEGSYGYPSEALKEELRRHEGQPVSISGGEKQRLATARTFMRISMCQTRLVVVDEATSALDPIAELALLRTMRKMARPGTETGGGGMTVVYVTHRFHRLAHDADRILCMKDGRLVENGTHAQLMMRAQGEYAALYKAQMQSLGG